MRPRGDVAVCAPRRGRDRQPETGQGTTFGDRDLYGLGRPGRRRRHGLLRLAVRRGDGRPVGPLGGEGKIAGCVVDGAIRDTALHPRTWSAGVECDPAPAAARYRYETVQMNGPVSLCGHLVNPGDYVVADIDGVCVIPFFDVPAVVEHCENAYRNEVAFIDRIDCRRHSGRTRRRADPGTPPLTADVDITRRNTALSSIHADPPSTFSLDDRYVLEDGPST